MCGIVGIYGTENKEIVKRMIKEIDYRGPDSKGFFNDSNISLGSCRLSIIDLESKNQPIFNEDGSLCIVFNGEIYNHKELRADLEKKGHSFSSNTDTEVILHVYEEYNADFLNYLDGMFAFALYDIDNKKLLLARDRLGIKPLYYFCNKDFFIFASEVKSILASGLVSRKIDIGKIDSFLTLRYVPGEDTMIKGIKRVNPGEFIEITKKNIKKNYYWHLKPGGKCNIIEALEKSVKDQLCADVPVGIFLSGGLDSSVIVALASKFNEKIRTYSLGFENYDKNEFNYAKIVSEKFNTDHKEIFLEKKAVRNMDEVVWYCDEPLADPTALPTLYLSREAKKDCKVVLTGEGCDEIFAGYEQYKLMRMKFLFDKLSKKYFNNFFSALLAKSNNIFLNNKLSEFIRKDNHEAYQELISIFNSEEKLRLYNNLNVKHIPEFKNNFSTAQLLLNQQLFDTKVSLPNNLLIKLDRMTMAESIESRVPFLQHDIVQSALFLPAKDRLRFFNEKYYLKNKMKNILPRCIIKRKKQRFFVPIDSWCNDELNQYIDEILDKPNQFLKFCFDTRHIRKLIDYKNSSSYKYILKHNSLLQLYYSRQLWNIAILNRWYNLFIENK